MKYRMITASVAAASTLMVAGAMAQSVTPIPADQLARMQGTWVSSPYPGRTEVFEVRGNKVYRTVVSKPLEGALREAGDLVFEIQGYDRAIPQDNGLPPMLWLVGTCYDRNVPHGPFLVRTCHNARWIPTVLLDAQSKPTYRYDKLGVDALTGIKPEVKAYICSKSPC